MARIRFKKPKIAVLMSEVISLTIWLFLGDKVINVLNGLVGADGYVNGTIFEDAYEIMGLGMDETGTSNSDNGLLGVIGLVMVVMVLMNFVSYN